MIIAQISDCHVTAAGERTFGAVDANANLAAVVARLKSLTPQPDLIMATGDLTADGRAEEYAALASLLDGLRAPLFVIPGNHDHRARMREAFPAAAYLPGSGFLQYVLEPEHAEGNRLRIVALDTQIPGKAGGALCPARLSWLETTLSREPGRPTLLAMHHPPVDIGIAWLDRLGLQGRDQAAALVGRHRQVVGVLAGHVHRMARIPWAGTTVTTAPSTAYQFPLDLDPTGPRRWIGEPPGYCLHVWRPGRGLDTHFGVVGDFGTSRSFPD